MKHRLLITDDNLDLVGTLLELLGDMFESIDTAYNVDMACRMLKETTYSLIILDINLNNRNGAEVVKFVNEDESNTNKNTPILILSGIITPQFIDHYKNRFASILSKPFDHSELRKIIQERLPADQSEEPIKEYLEDIPDFKYAGPFAVAALKEEVDQVLVQVKKNSKLKQLFKMAKIDRNADNYIGTHVSMIINISAAICTRLEWNSDKTLEKFVYAAYLHDMPLAMRPDLAHINTFEKLELLKETFTEEEYRIIFEHSNIAAKLISDINEIPSDVEMMVRQHHEMPNSTGFPAKVGHQKITPLSAIFIVAHHLADYIIENPKWTMEEFVKKYKTRLHGSHFTKIMRELPLIK